MFVFISGGFMYNPIPIPSTLSIVSNCWQDAEAELCSLVKKKYHDLDEEFITKLFYSELNFLLAEASRKSKVENAFLIDLRRAFPQVQSFHLSSISANLIADVTLHKREIEKVTGGDFGFTITRPQISQRLESGLVIEEYRRGLLCQAKLKRRNRQWGQLTENQQKILPDHTNYLSLLLYSYSDPERCLLNSFDWQLCEKASLESIQSWLKSGEFPSLINAGKIIDALGNAHIGTDDQETIEKVIRPEGKPCLSIRIYWPPDKKPPSHIYMTEINHAVQKVKSR